MSSPLPRVTIVGAGLAGMTTALRLAERGYAVTIYEQDEQPGGQYGGHRDPQTGLFHEHSLHLFLNWYRNFWRIASELGLGECFEARTTLKFLRQGEFPKTTELSNVGAPESWMKNITSGVIPAPDMWLYGYSLLDLISEPLDQGQFLGMVSVNGFMHSRPYATNRSAEQHNRTLAKAFASYSYGTSASTYRNYISNSFRVPNPMMWVLKGNCYDHFIAPFERRLEALGVRIETLSAVRRLGLDANGRVREIEVARVDRSPSEYRAQAVTELRRETIPVAGAVVLAIPPRGLLPLIDEAVYRHAPGLARVEGLRTAPMASLHLHFKRRLDNIPREHTVLMGSPHHITFIDNSQLWPGYDHTCLNLVASETYGFSALPMSRAVELLLDELAQYVPFNKDDVDYDLTFLQSNTGDQLMLHDVGSWYARPATYSGLPNVFLAGDYCRTFVDVVSVESAVVSGLVAAEAIRRLDQVGEPVQILRPKRYPRALLQAAKWGLAPYAALAKVMSSAIDQGQRVASRTGRQGARTAGSSGGGESDR